MQWSSLQNIMSKCRVSWRLISYGCKQFYSIENLLDERSGRNLADFRVSVEFDQLLTKTDVLNNKDTLYDNNLASIIDIYILL